MSIEAISSSLPSVAAMFSDYARTNATIRARTIGSTTPTKATATTPSVDISTIGSPSRFETPAATVSLSPQAALLTQPSTLPAGYGVISPLGSSDLETTAAPVGTAPGTSASSETLASNENTTSAASSSQTENTSSKIGRPRGTDGEPLDNAEMKAVNELRQRDAEVRAHEQAHLAVAGRYATSGAQYSYQTGPDGNRYAIGGEVGIDTSSESDPSQTIAKMRVVRRAALAPARPSSQDRQIAASANQTEINAMAKLMAMRQQEAAASAAEASAEDGETSAYQPKIAGSGAIGAVSNAVRPLVSDQNSVMHVNSQISANASRLAYRSASQASASGLTLVA